MNPAELPVEGSRDQLPSEAISTFFKRISELSPSADKMEILGEIAKMGFSVFNSGRVLIDLDNNRESNAFLFQVNPEIRKEPFYTSVGQDDRIKILAENPVPHLCNQLTSGLTIRVYFTGHSNASGSAMMEILEQAFQMACATIEKCELIKATRQESNHFMLMAEFLPHMVWTCNSKGEIDYVNKKCTHVTGLPKHELIANGWKDVMHAEDLRLFGEQWLVAVKTGQLLEIDVRIRNYFGYQYRWFNFKCSPVPAPEGGTFSWLACAMDIDQMVTAKGNRDHMIKIASHELKGPITTINAYLQLLEKMNQPDVDALKYLDKARAYTKKLNNLVHVFLDRPTSIGTVEYEFTPVNLGQIVEDSIETYSKTCPTHRIILRGTSSPGTVLGDKEKLEQVVGNLLHNGVKYSPDANKIIVTVTAEKHHVKVLVTDFGIGITNEFIPKLFNAESRSAHARANFPGTGYGLFLCNEIIKKHQGEMGVNSKEGLGSTFYFSIPCIGC
jgi:two-component system CheB/CheR fusion protein